MNPAKRIHNIIIKIQPSGDRQALKIFEKIFDVKGCKAVANKLAIMDSQVLALSTRGHPKETITFLSNLFSCYNLARDLVAEMPTYETHRIGMEAAMAYLPSDMDNIDPNDLTDISDMLEQLRAKLESGTIPEEYKSIIESFIDEIRYALTDIEYGGVDAFAPHIETAFGKVTVYHEAFEKGGIIQEVNDLFAKATKIMDDAQIWTGAIGYAIAKLTQ